MNCPRTRSSSLSHSYPGYPRDLWVMDNLVTLDYRKREVVLSHLYNAVPFVIVSLPYTPESINTVRHMQVPNQRTDWSTFEKPVCLPLYPFENLALYNFPFNEQQQQSINSLLSEFSRKFNSRPGLHNSFSYKFNNCDHNL